jgi:NAD+ kinase
MKIKIVGRHIEDILPVLENKDIEIVDSNPDLVIAHGGDGALLGAEREFSTIPKLPIRDYKTAPRCEEHASFEHILDQCLAGKLEQSELIKIGGFANGEKLLGINDIFIHNADRGGALRYRLFIDDELYEESVIGDGVGISTVHGSTAYYRSITHSIFKIGIGLAFNNSTEATNHLVLPEDTVIRVEMTRGPALLVADNSPKMLEINSGDTVLLKKVQDKAYVLGLEMFMCSKCRKLRHSQNR